MNFKTKRLVDMVLNDRTERNINTINRFAMWVRSKKGFDSEKVSRFMAYDNIAGVSRDFKKQLVDLCINGVV